MLFTKINPVAAFTENTGPFTESITTQAEYLTVIARSYAPGTDKTNFEVKFGNIVKDNEGNPISFTNVSNIQATLTKEELTNWGTNDEVLLTIVATKVGTNATEFINLNSNSNF